MTWDGTIYHAENLDILRDLPTGSMDLIATDPPFNKGNTRSTRENSYQDSWRWEDQPRRRGEPVPREWLHRIGDENPALQQVILAAEASSGQEAGAYLCFLGLRLIEMRRVLRDSGSIYIQCDHAASAHIRMAMDAVFGNQNFRNEIIWKRTNAHNDGRKFGCITDCILLYALPGYTWNQEYRPYSEEQLARYSPDREGRHYTGGTLASPRPYPGRMFNWRGVMPKNGWRYSKERLEQLWDEGLILTRTDGRPRLDGLKIYLDETLGKPVQNLWDDIPRVSNTGRERTHHPDQKPEALYRRIIETSSNPGEMVLDPFAGSGTTLAAAQTSGRRWTGIERRPEAVETIRKRLAGEGMFRREICVLTQVQPEQPEPRTTEKTPAAA